jgi:hypothetical protein
LLTLVEKSKLPARRLDLIRSYDDAFPDFLVVKSLRAWRQSSHYRGIGMRWLMTLSVVCLALSAAQSTGAAVGGGGGAPYVLRCLDGDFVRGFGIMQGDMLDAIFVYCGKSDGRSVAPVSWEPGVRAGGTGGRSVPMMCGKDELVSGLEAKSRNVSGTIAIADIKVFCTHVHTGRRRTLRTGWRDPDEYPDPYGYRPLDCPGSLLGRGYVSGIDGGAGNWVDRIGLLCGVVPQPSPDVVLDPGVPVTMPPRPPIREVGKRQRCLDYARNASAIRNEAAGCGLSGPRFDAAYEQHYAACIANNRDFDRAETNARAEAIAKCRAEGRGGSGAPQISERPGFCQIYVQDTMAQAAEGQQHCGYSGARYSAYPDDHLNWCKSVTQAAANAEAAARGREIWACRRCRGYAQRALDQFERARACRTPVPDAPVWTRLPYDGHFNWCLQTGGNGERNETPSASAVERLRERHLNACLSRPLE